MTIDSLFPNGASQYIIGGLLIGCGVSVAYLLTGHIAGLSSFFTSVQSWWSRRAFFRQEWVLAERNWKAALVIGLIAGAALYSVTSGSPWVTEVAWWRLLGGGILVGLGTRIARGCTSGHGICGIAAFTPSSILTTLIFMAVAIATAACVSMTGVTP